MSPRKDFLTFGQDRARLSTDDSFKRLRRRPRLSSDSVLTGGKSDVTSIKQQITVRNVEVALMLVGIGQADFFQERSGCRTE